MSRSRRHRLRVTRTSHAARTIVSNSFPPEAAAALEARREAFERCLRDPRVIEASGGHLSRGSPVLAVCPCCGYPTIAERGRYETCKICDWDDDGQDDVDAGSFRERNRHSLTDARKHFAEHGHKFALRDLERNAIIRGATSEERRALVVLHERQFPGSRRGPYRNAVQDLRSSTVVRATSAQRTAMVEIFESLLPQADPEAYVAALPQIVRAFQVWRDVRDRSIQQLAEAHAARMAETHPFPPEIAEAFRVRREAFERCLRDPSVIEAACADRPHSEALLAVCPCCCFPTIHERGGYDACPICSWEDDGEDGREGNELIFVCGSNVYRQPLRMSGGPNYQYTLAMARSNFAAHGHKYALDDFERSGLKIVTRALRASMVKLYQRLLPEVNPDAYIASMPALLALLEMRSEYLRCWSRQVTEAHRTRSWQEAEFFVLHTFTYEPLAAAT